MLTNMMLLNVLHVANLELQHPVFMMFIAFATVITGGILRYRMIIFGGIIFGLLAYASSYFNLREQLVLEAIAWLIAFIIPGHLLYANRKK
jgi:branched-subunit amino acid ABC-type transport system permease component